MKRQKLVIILLFFIASLLLYIAWSLGRLYYFAQAPLKIPTNISSAINVDNANLSNSAGVNITPPITFFILPGTNAYKLAEQLHDLGVLEDPKQFVRLATIERKMSHLQAGEYSIEPGMTAQQLLTKIASGQVVMHKVTLVEGWTFKQDMDAIEGDSAITHTLTGKNNKEIMKALGHPGINPEGLFYPSTYLFKLGTKDTLILKIAYDLMQRKLQQEWQNRSKNVPYKRPYQALIAASLIEKETAKPNERPLISGVIIKRLQKGMRLQIDPTVIYALGDKYTGNLTHDNMKIDSPYNTYRYKGLPPTPIAMPSISSINAALHPVISNALFYVAKGDGSHIFSDTLQEQDQAIKKYLLPKKTDNSKENKLSLSKDLYLASISFLSSSVREKNEQ